VQVAGILSKLDMSFTIYIVGIRSITKMAGSPPPLLIHNILEEFPEFSQLIVLNSGEGHNFGTLCKLRACSKNLHKNEPMAEMHGKYQTLFSDFSQARLAARKNVKSKQSLTLCFEEMLRYEKEPYFFDAMEEMLNISAEHMHIDAVSARMTMVHVSELFEKYDWKKFCTIINTYIKLHRILDVFVEYITEVVLGCRTNLFFRITTHDGPPPGGMTRDDYFAQERRILGKIGDAGVVDSLWAACKCHPTNLPVQAKMLGLLDKMTRSRSMHRVRDMLKIPGNMFVVENILKDMKIGLDGSDLNYLFSSAASEYVRVVGVMFDSDPVFTPDEEGQVVDAVHNFIARCFRNDMMTSTMLNSLLYVVVDRVRTSTLRKLTNDQINVICNSDLFRSDLVTKRQATTLLRRARAANDIHDSAGIPTIFD